jgi:hypothetical protein
MPSYFADAFSALSPEFDDRFGEPFTLIAQIEDDRAEFIEKGEDRTIPERILTGIFSDDPVTVQTLGSGANTHDNNDVLSRRTMIDFALELFADPVAQPYPKAGWILQANDEPGLPQYQVISAQPDGVSRLNVRVIYIGLAPTTGTT